MRIALIIVTVLFSIVADSQNFPFAEYRQYPFLNVDTNRFHFYGDSSKFQHFVDKLNQLQTQGNNKVKILHIGDSHIQADFFSGRIRQRLHETFPGGNGGMELVFPYKAAKTNSSYIYASDGIGEWLSCRNVMSNTPCDLGITGISMTTFDSTAGFYLRFRKNIPITYDFNEIKIFSVKDSHSYQLTVNDLLPVQVDTLEKTIVSTYTFPQFCDSISCKIQKSDTSQKNYTLMGIMLNQNTSGIVYNMAGINGAEVRSFLRCNQLPQQIAYLNPDLIVVSLGTNDCYSVRWDSASFVRNLSSFVDMLQLSCKETPIILTTPADHYRKRKHLNRDVAILSAIQFQIAKSKNLIVWDLYSVMGGQNSIIDWMKYDLANRDKIHFTKYGYILQGDLFFEAFLDSYSKFNKNYE